MTESGVGGKRAVVEMVYGKCSHLTILHLYKVVPLSLDNETNLLLEYELNLLPSTLSRLLVIMQTEVNVRPRHVRLNHQWDNN